MKVIRLRTATPLNPALRRLLVCLLPGGATLVQTTEMGMVISADGG